MVKAKYLWALAKSCWSRAVDYSVAMFVFVSVINYLLQGRISEAANTLSSFMPIFTAVFFIVPLVIVVFLISGKEARNWIRLNRYLWAVFQLVVLIFSCYLIAITELIPKLPLSDWIYREEVGGAVLAILFVLAIVIVITGKSIKKPQTQ